MAVSRKLFHPSDLEVFGWGFRRFGDSIPGYRYGASKETLPLRQLRPFLIYSTCQFVYVVIESCANLLTAFLSTLRTNIHLSNSDSLSSSTMSTPTSPPQPSTLLPHPNPSPLSITTPASPVDPSPAPLPALTTIPATTPTDRVEALRLIADSVAQQRQIASYAVITHPTSLATILCLLAILAKYFDFPVFLTTTTGIIMAFLLAVRVASGPYLIHAENINWNWLVEGSSLAGNNDSNKKYKGEELIVLVTKWGEDIIGALAMRLSKRDRRAYIKAWTVKLRFRGKEIGRALLEEAVKIAVSEKGCRGIEFEEEHASQYHLSPRLGNQRTMLTQTFLSLQTSTASFPPSSMALSTSGKHGRGKRWRMWWRSRRGRTRGIQASYMGV